MRHRGKRPGGRGGVWIRFTVFQGTFDDVRMHSGRPATLRARWERHDAWGRSRGRFEALRRREGHYSLGGGLTGFLAVQRVRQGAGDDSRIRTPLRDPSRALLPFKRQRDLGALVSSLGLPPAGPGCHGTVLLCGGDAYLSGYGDPRQGEEPTRSGQPSGKQGGLASAFAAEDRQA